MSYTKNLHMPTKGISLYSYLVQFVLAVYIHFTGLVGKLQTKFVAWNFGTVVFPLVLYGA